MFSLRTSASYYTSKKWQNIEEKTAKGEVSINSHIHVIVCLVVSGSSWKALVYFCAILYALWKELFSLEKLDSFSATRFNFYYWQTTRWHVHVSTGTSEFTCSLVAKLYCKMRKPNGLHRIVVCW